jgi:general secretion pathway protein G
MTRKHGFTLIELLIIIAIIGILVSIAVPRYQALVEKSKQGATKGNLATIRSSLSVYYGDNDQIYPEDDLTSLTLSTKYLPMLPPTKLPPAHAADIDGVTTEVTPTETGMWSYNNDRSSTHWGKIVVGCLHTDAFGSVWTSF